MPLFTSIGLALGATAAGAFGVGLGAAAVGTSIIGSSIYSASQSGRKKTSAPALPQAPSVSAAEGTAKEITKRKRLAMQRSTDIYTSPLGISGEAEVAKKSLLGQ